MNGAVSCCLLLASWLAPLQAAAPTRYEFSQPHMGIPFKVTLYAADQRTANLNAQAAFARIGELDSLLSDYDPESELSRLSATAGSGKAVPVGADLWRVLERSQRLAIETGGAFDATVGPLVRLWRRARRTKEMPSPQRLAEARQATGYRHLELDAQARTAKLLVPGMRLDLGGIAVGYAVDEAFAVLKQRGIKRAMIDGSGDIYVGDPPPGEKGWKIGVSRRDAPAGSPGRFLLLANCAVTTSGDAFQHVEIGGVRYSHIVDPKTGLGLTDRSSVTLIAPDCTTADSLATAVSVLGPDRGLKLVEATSGAASFIECAAANGSKQFVSQRWKDYELAPPTLK